MSFLYWHQVYLIWFPQGPFYYNCAARYSRWSPSYEEGWRQLDGFRRLFWSLWHNLFEDSTNQDARFRFFKRISNLDGPLPLWSPPVRSNRRQDPVYRDCTVWCPTGTDIRTFYFQPVFNLSDLQKHVKCPRYQYAVDTTFLVHSKTKDLANGVEELNDAIWRLGNYSSESNLALNEAKTKWMLVVTRQMSRA